MSISDAQFVGLVEDCSEIVRLQGALKQKMSDGIFGMAMARKGGCVVTPFNCREDFDASITVSVSAPDAGCGSYEVWERKPDMDPLLLISGLPPPALKKSQKHFSAALRDVIEIAGVVRKIEHTRSQLAGAGLDEGMGGLSVSGEAAAAMADDN